MTPRQRLDNAVLKASHDHMVTRADILGRSRLKQISQARQQAYAELKAQGWSYPRIGRAFGRDHGTIWHGVRRHWEREGVSA